MGGGEEGEEGLDRCELDRNISNPPWYIRSINHYIMSFQDACEIVSLP